jgi:hypothetical protein
MRLRDQMPQTADFLNFAAELIGRVELNALVKKAQEGSPVFYAAENGFELGTKMTERGKWVSPFVPKKIEENKAK